MHIRKKTLIATLVLGVAGTGESAEIKYMLWDSLQQPAYQQCAVDFAKKTPGTTVKIVQSGWDDYWTAISTGFIAGTAPDVFTNHLSKYPEFAKNGQLVDLSPYISKDKLDTNIYVHGLFEPWGGDGKQYGLPKDWDTVALIVNMAHAKKAGVSLSDLHNMTWNPRDGGSFEQIVKKLTVDVNGVNASSPQFNSKRIAVYGYQNPGGAGMTGQTEWSHFAVSNGFKYQDRRGGRRYFYDDPKLAETMDWLASLPAKHLSVSYPNSRSLGADALFMVGKVAMIAQGSWAISYFASRSKFETAWVPLPIGPSGRRASMLNGLADSIWSGSKVKAEAWLWVKYLASADCQNIVAEAGAVFPAIHGTAEKTVAAHKRRGVDSTAFVTMSQAQTFSTPIGDHGAEINELMKGAIESILYGQQKATPALKAANEQINRLLK